MADEKVFQNKEGTEEVKETQRAFRVELSDVLRDLSEEDAENLDLYLEPVWSSDVC